MPSPHHLHIVVQRLAAPVSSVLCDALKAKHRIHIG